MIYQVERRGIKYLSLWYCYSNEIKELWSVGYIARTKETKA
jgi:hypothetical protein